jgi:hypothetical protein
MQGFKSMNDRRTTLIDLYQLRSDIMQTDLAICNASIANSLPVRESEIGKMTENRDSANIAYDRLNSSDLSCASADIFKAMKEDRPKYIIAQIKVVDSIRKIKTPNADDLIYYQALMDRYVHRVDAMIKLETESTYLTHNHVQSAMAAVLAISLIITSWVLWRMFR